MSSKVSIAILGATGILTQNTLPLLLDPIFANKVQFPIKVVTRQEMVSTDEITYVKGALDETGVDAVIEQLKDVDVILELCSYNPIIAAATEKLAAAVRPKMYIPSQFGSDVEESDLILPKLFQSKIEHSSRLRNLGIKVVDIYTGFFDYPGSYLHEVVAHVGIDVASNSVVYVGSPDNKLSYTSVEDIGHVVAAVATSIPTSLPDVLRVESGKTTLGQIVARFEKAHNSKLSIKVISEENALQKAKDIVAKGLKSYSDFLSCLNALVLKEGNAGVLFVENENELINPHESLWTWKKAFKKVEAF